MANGTFIALMRGINVGGKNKLPMKELASMFAEAGCEDVRTFIQSGNVIFKAPAKVVKSLPSELVKEIEARHKIRVPIVLRTAEELADVPKHNPFLKRKDADEDLLHILFLADTPTAAQVKALDPNRSPGDEYILRGRDIFLRLPNGVADTKLTNKYFDTTLGTISTGRNWRTLKKLIELSAG